MHRRTALVIGLFLIFGGSAMAADYASKDEARQFVERAIAHFDQVGKAKALADFSDPKGGFIDRDLYIAVFDFDGLTLAQGAAPKLVGINRMDQTDSNGKPYIREIIEVARKNGEGWVEYMRNNPQTKKIEEKVTFTKVHEGLVFMCGAYKAG
jgi:cytochrome c